jgi:hypothetical protein
MQIHTYECTSIRTCMASRPGCRPSKYTDTHIWVMIPMCSYTHILISQIWVIDTYMLLHTHTYNQYTYVSDDTYMFWHTHTHKYTSIHTCMFASQPECRPSFCVTSFENTFYRTLSIENTFYTERILAAECRPSFWVSSFVSPQSYIDYHTHACVHQSTQAYPKP